MEEKEKVNAEETAEEKETEAACPPGEEAKEEKSELDRAMEEVKAANDKYLRLAAEYDNFRKRTAKEKEALFGTATASTVAPFLTVYDNLERAMDNACTDENYKKGVELIFAEFKNTLEALKVEILDPKGEAFDPNFHNAVMHEENEEYGENIVSEVFQKGAKLGDRVIRPAMVKVAN